VELRAGTSEGRFWTAAESSCNLHRWFKKGFDLDGNMQGMNILVFPELGKYLLFIRNIKFYPRQDNDQ
jgi:hypothetical protein